MGEVYLAKDTDLDRLVALKILSSEFTSDQQRVLRFVQEAKAASALNHPNILTIYESGKAETTAFIAAEFVDGLTLRQHMQPTAMKLSEILDVAIQVASALLTAHAAGIIHRDMKPENVMIRPDGYVKVLDFGLAKLTEAKQSDSGATTLVETEPGVVMGTTRYMSPEQVRGLEVDARTDIWSLGVMLYEMCAERPPFGGATNSDVMAAILEREPVPLARYSRDLPESLEWIVTKSLNKEKDERYQTARELLSDLRKVKRREEFDAEVERSTPPELESSPLVATKGGPSPLASQTAKSEVVTAGVVAPALSSPEYTVRAVKRYKKTAAVAVAFVVLGLGGISFALYERWRNSTTKLPAAKKFEQLTNTGNVTEVAISPDGEYLVYATDDRRSLWLKLLPAGSVQPIVQPVSGGFNELSFSKDRSGIYYTTSRQPGAGPYWLNQIPIRGGSLKKVADLADRPEYTFSPDGKRLAFTKSDAEGEVTLVVANSDGTGQQKLASHQSPNWCTRLAWSPDGKMIACPAEMNDRELYQTVVGISVADGKEEALTSKRWQEIDRVVWLGDGGRLLITAQDQGKVSLQVWELRYPGGQVENITNDQKDYFGLVVTSNAESLVTMRGDTLVSVWVDETKLPFESNRNVSSFDWTADGRIVYDSESDEGTDLWIAGPNDKTPVRLTSDGLNRMPSVSPDGLHIVFMKGTKQDAHVWRLDHDRSLHQLTKGVGESSPCVSPDGKWIVYKADVFGLSALWKISIDGGEPVRVTDQPSESPAISPDGDLIACAYKTDENSQPRIALIPFAGGKPKQFDIAPTALFPIRWTNDRKALAYVDVRDGVSNIWTQPIAGGPPGQLTKFNSGSIFWFDWSPDGKHLALARGTSTSDVVLISNFR